MNRFVPYRRFPACPGFADSAADFAQQGQIFPRAVGPTLTLRRRRWYKPPLIFSDRLLISSHVSSCRTTHMPFRALLAAALVVCGCLIDSRVRADDNATVATEAAAAPSAEPGRPAEKVGWLRPNNSHRDVDAPYALVDSSGRVRCYVRPREGVNLSEFSTSESARSRRNSDSCRLGESDHRSGRDRLARCGRRRVSRRRNVARPPPANRDRFNWPNMSSLRRGPLPRSCRRSLLGLKPMRSDRCRVRSARAVWRQTRCGAEITTVSTVPRGASRDWVPPPAVAGNRRATRVANASAVRPA